MMLWESYSLNIWLNEMNEGGNGYAIKNIKMMILYEKDYILCGCRK